MVATLYFVLLMLLAPASASAIDDHREVRGITVSTPTWGWEWGTAAMDSTLDAIKSDGANWVAIHPYATINADGRVTWRPIDPDNPPAWLTRPIQQAHARGIKVLIKPHLAYWGSPFSWRGDIRFADPAARARFFTSYERWLLEVAAACHDADALAVGTELDGMTGDEQAWRSLIGKVRQRYSGHLTYAANWDAYDRVPFWDALDTIGIQAYFPVLAAGQLPTPHNLDQGWRRITADLRRFSQAAGKPIVFTELGYDAGKNAAHQPWKSGSGAPQVQRAAIAAALRMLDREPSIRGAFLWKWFPGEVQRGDFRLSDPTIRTLLREAWK